MNPTDRFRRVGYLHRGKTPPWWQSLALMPIALRCKLVGWRRDEYGRIVRAVRPGDPPSALFRAGSTVWMEDRWAGGERVICWSYWHAFAFDLGAIGALIEEGA